MTRVLVVCLGNICRSPTAEAVLRAKAREASLDIEVDSAGTGDWHVGDPPYPQMIAAAGRRGYDLTPLRARQFEAGDFHRFDLILAADAQNLADIEALRPPGSDTEVRLYMEGTGTGAAEIPDPYHTRDFDGALDLIERATERLVAQLQ